MMEQWKLVRSTQMSMINILMAIFVLRMILKIDRKLTKYRKHFDHFKDFREQVPND